MILIKNRKMHEKIIMFEYIKNNLKIITRNIILDMSRMYFPQFFLSRWKRIILINELNSIDRKINIRNLFVLNITSLLSTWKYSFFFSMVMIYWNIDSFRWFIILFLHWWRRTFRSFFVSTLKWNNCSTWLKMLSVIDEIV